MKIIIELDAEMAEDYQDTKPDKIISDFTYDPDYFIEAAEIKIEK